MKQIYFFLLALMYFFTSNAQLTQTVNNTIVLDDYYGSPNLNISVPKFNVASGLLTGANISITISNVGRNNRMGVENLSTVAATATARKRLEYNMDILHTTGGAVNKTLPSTIINNSSRSFAIYDNIKDYAGASGFTQSDNVINTNYTYAGDIASFAGGAGDAIDVLSISEFLHSYSISGGGGGISSSLVTYYDLTVAVTYTYTATLPLTLSSFSGKYFDANRVDLKWKTTYEENIDHFEVEYSRDGRQFETVTRVASKGGNGDALYNYSHLNNNVSNKVIFYRLKYVEMDGKVEYSNVIRIDINNSNPTTYIAYPNPIRSAQGQLNVSGKMAAGVYAVYSMDGRVMISKDLVTEGSNLSIDIQMLKVGNYLVKTPDGKSLKFVVI